ncbi:MAG: beta-propeller fold lactonase family protein [Archangiaceae bacterium]|nr:beta-propeller fold lactonase family protein [Archangiaceae bacterium]
MVATPRGVYVAVEGSVDPRNSAVAFLAAGPTGLDPDAGCVGTDAGRCGAFAAALRGPQGLALSPDGKNLYVVTADDDAVLTLSLGADGAPRFVSCVQSMDAPSARRECAAFAPGLNAAQGVVVSPDGRFVYVAAEASRAISVFSRR